MRSSARRLPALLIVALLGLGLILAPPAAADQCAPPGIDSASALPTNLAAAAQGPEQDRYTTATTAPLDSIDVAALGLGTAGTLTVGTLSDAPPSICINAAGQFTGFDNEVLRAIAEKLGLRVNFVGTDFSGLLAQVASRRFDVGSSSITTTEPRGAPSASPTAMTSATSRWWCPAVRRSPASPNSGRASASAWCRAPSRSPTWWTPSGWTR